MLINICRYVNIVSSYDLGQQPFNGRLVPNVYIEVDLMDQILWVLNFHFTSLVSYLIDDQPCVTKRQLQLNNFTLVRITGALKIALENVLTTQLLIGLNDS